VGHLYRGIEAGLAALCARYGEDAVFIGPPRAQVVTDIFEWPELIAVTDLASARQAIETIVEQGEGARGDWLKSHFGTFVGILEDLLAEQAADPAFNPARPIEPAYVRLPPDVQAGTLIEDPGTAQVADLANGLYEVTLQVLSRYYIHHRETAAELNTLARTAKTPDELGDARPGPGADRLASGPVPPGPDRGPDLRHRPPRHLRAAAPGRGLEDHHRTARRAAAGLRCPQPASRPRRARPAQRKAAVDEPGHRGPRLQNGQPATAAAHDSRPARAMTGEGETSP
jgi:Ferritin-like